MNIKEVCRFLGIYKSDIETEKKIYKQWDAILNLSAKRHNIVPFSVSQPPFPLYGDDIKNHLSGCNGGYVFLATLGSSVDTYIKKLQLASMSDAVIADAVAGVILEEYCDEICLKLSEKHPVTSRFSPGYGDFPISLQKDILRVAGAEKIGVSCLESYMMVPSKSVSAIIGIKENL